MSYHEADNVWLVCLNCETEFSLEDLFYNEEEGTESIECAICGGHEFRRCDSYGINIEEEYDYYESW